jgi:hypothetical protein
VTVRRNEPWGDSGPLPEEAVVVDSDAAARAVVTGARRQNAALPTIGLTGGDLCRTLGGTGEAHLRSADASRVRVDVGSVLLDGRQYWFVAHLVARRSWWRGRIVAVMNAEFVGHADVAPRSHPADGRFDIVDADLGPADRWKAWRRLRHGGHVPHPRITERRMAAWQTTFDPPLRVWLDGEPMGEARQLSVRVEPDALLVVV